MLVCLVQVKHHHSKGNTGKKAVQDTGGKVHTGHLEYIFLEVKIIIFLIAEVISKQLIFTYILSTTTHWHIQLHTTQRHSAELCTGKSHPMWHQKLSISHQFANLKTPKWGAPSPWSLHNGLSCQAVTGFALPAITDRKLWNLKWRSASWFFSF